MVEDASVGYKRLSMQKKDFLRCKGPDGEPCPQVYQGEVETNCAVD